MTTPNPRFLSRREIEAYRLDFEATYKMGRRIPRSIERALFRTALELFRQRSTLARLAADGPRFNSPIEAWEAEGLRDQVLQNPEQLDTAHELTASCRRKTG